MRRIHKPLLVAAVILLSFGVGAIAQSDDADADDPNRGAARISVIQGDVNVKRGDSGEVVAAVLNAPLMADDHLQTSDGSRSEIQFDAGSLVRLAPETDLGLTLVAHNRYQMQLASGTIIYRVLRDLHSDAEIDTPSIAVHPRRVGVYRISVYSDGTTSVTVREGQAEIFSPKGSQTLGGRQTMLARGSTSDPEFQVETEIAADQFDDWSTNRDRDVFAVNNSGGGYSQQPEYVPPDVAGTEDLNSYGTWVPSSYGTVWAPRVGPTWAPYQYGRWVWSGYYGWTWVDYDPWGWAPFHYGRWFWNTGRWCWWPGPAHRPFYWRPAVVGFFGFGGGGVGFGVGFGFGNVGWVPLAPYETYHPWYGRRFSGGYNRAVVNTTVVNNTIIHNTNIYNTYRNARVNNSIAYVNSNNFGRGTQQFYWARQNDLHQASLVRGQLPVTPERRSLAFSNRAPSAAPQRFAASENQQFFMHQRPPAVERASFEQQQQQMARFQERSLGVRPNLSADQPQRQNPAQISSSYRAGAPQQGQAQRPLNNQENGWQRFGQAPRSPQPGANNQSFRQPQQPIDNAWHRFGDPGASSFSRPAVQNNNNDGWHTFGSPGVRQEPRLQNRFQSNRPTEQQAPQRFADPMRMNPPIVNDRPSSSGPRYNPQQQFEQRQQQQHYEQPQQRFEQQRRFEQSQPRYEAPRYSPPQQHFEQQRGAPQHFEAPHNSAPSGGGHGGGGGHSDGGGGGRHR